MKNILKLFLIVFISTGLFAAEVRRANNVAQDDGTSCKACQLKFSSPDQRQAHENSPLHHANCLATYRLKARRARRRTSDADGNDTVVSSYPCLLCNKAFRDRDELDAHFKSEYHLKAKAAFNSQHNANDVQEEEN